MLRRNRGVQRRHVSVFPVSLECTKGVTGRRCMIDEVGTKLLCMLAFIGIAACRDVGVPDVCRQKISQRLFNELSDALANERKYRIVIRLNDSAGVAEAVPSLTVANNAAATGSVTAAEIRKLCILRQVIYIDLPKQFHKLEQN